MLIKLTLLTLGLLPLQPLALPTDFPIGTIPRFHPSPQLQTLAEEHFYTRAFSLIDAERWSELRQQLHRGPNRALNQYLLWLDIHRPVRHDFSTISTFIREHPHWPDQALLQRRAEEAMTEATPPQQVLDWFTERLPLTTDGHIRLVAALRQDGQLTAATQLARKTWAEQVFGPAQARRFLETQGDLLRPVDHWARLNRLLLEGHLNAARGLLPQVDSGHQTLARARIGLRSFHPHVDELVAAVPQRLQNDPGLLYERFRWRLKQGRTQAALELLAEVPRPLGYAEYWWPELSTLIRQAMQQGDYPQAYQIAAQHDQTLPKYAVEGDWLAGWLALRYLGRADAAVEHFRQLYQRANYPISKARGAYWAGRSLALLDKPLQARQWFLRAAIHQETFYGQQAAHHVTLESQQLALPQEHPQPLDFDEHELVQAIQALIDLDQGHRVRPLLERLGELAQQQRRPALLVLAARFAQQLGHPSWALQIGKARAREGFLVPEAAFPTLDLVNQTVTEAADLVHAIIRQESLFEPRARSHAGASGLMQLMPRTAQAMAESLELDYRPRWLVDDPQYNIRLGHAYIQRMLERWDGNLILAIASYNAGPTRVQSWLEEFGDPRHWSVDPIDWVETIPYAETRNYVQRVMENLHIYRQRLQPLALAELHLRSKTQ